MVKSTIYKNLLLLLLPAFLLVGCGSSDDSQSTLSTTIQPSPSSTAFPSSTPTPIVLSSIENLVIQCGENIQQLGTVQKGYTLTLFKANGLEYDSSSNFIEGTLQGDIQVASEIKGTNLRLQDNTFAKTNICFIGFQNGDRYLGVMLPIARLLNERNLKEQFEGSFLIQTENAEFGIDWLTYHYSTSSKKNCILYKIIKNPYPCSQDCDTIETEPGCECFCANFLYYDENCIPTEINPDCICVCRDEGITLSPTVTE